MRSDIPSYITKNMKILFLAKAEPKVTGQLAMTVQIGKFPSAVLTFIYSFSGLNKIKPSFLAKCSACTDKKFNTVGPSAAVAHSSLEL